MDRKKELVKNTAILTVGKMCTQFIGFFLLPLYTAVLDTAEYGTFDLMISYGTLLIPLINWQLDQGMFRFLIDSRGNLERQKKIFSSIFTANVIQVSLFCFAMLLVNRFIKNREMLFLCAYVVLSVFTSLLLQFTRGIGNNKIYALSSFISATSTIILNILFLGVLKLQLKGLFLATIMASIITICYLVIRIKPYKFFSVAKIDKETLKDIQKYSIPLVPNNLAWWVVNVSDRSIISYVLGVASNGIYTVANKFSNLFITFYNIFNLSWTESVSLHFNDEDRDDFLMETINVLFGIFAGACLIIVAFMPFVFPHLVNVKYIAAYPQIIILMYAMLFRVFQGLYSCIYIAMKDSKKVATTSMASAIINIVVDVSLIRFVGLYAASISTLAAFGSMAIIRYIDINKYVRMRISPRVLISTSLMALILFVTYNMNVFFVNVVMAIVVLVFAFVLNIDFIKGGYKAILEMVKK